MSRTILDPPAWFWDLIDNARGEAARLADDLRAMDREGIALFYAYLRDLATKLTGPEYLANVAQPISDETAFERAAWVVAQGRGSYREAALDPSKMPADPRPARDPARNLLGVPGEVYSEVYGEEMPTDAAVAWRPDGSAEPQ